MTIKRVHVRVSGRVQGVFFRACTQEEAKKLCLSGWVRNSDTCVETEIQGDESDLRCMLAWLHRGSPGAAVQEVDVRQMEPMGGEKGFEIKY